MTTQNIKRKIIPILRRQGVTKAALFGSAARGEMNQRSDIDLLVKLSRDKTLLDLAGLRLDLQQKLGKKIDILTYNSIHPRLRSRILSEQKVIYEKRS